VARPERVGNLKCLSKQVLRAVLPLRTALLSSITA